MDNLNAALKILEGDIPNNISLINLIKNNTIYSIDIIGNSVLVRSKSDRFWVYVSCKEKNQLSILKSKLSTNDDNFAAY